MITVLCGGVGAARWLRVLRQHVDPATISAIVNVGDDLVMHGLTICPDLDTLLYTLTGRNNETLGWGLEGETWRTMEQLGRLGGENWFSLGDLDLATHLYRSQRLLQGATKTLVTHELSQRSQLDVELLPVTDDPIATVLETTIGRLTFQEYFVQHHHSPDVTAIEFVGASAATPVPLVLERLASAEKIIIAPSNPLLSIDPLLAVPGIRPLLAQRADDVVAISPLIGGRAVKGPTDQLMANFSLPVSAVGIAQHYQGLIGTLVIDPSDADQVDEIVALGCRVRVTPTLMGDPTTDSALVAAVLS